MTLLYAEGVTHHSPGLPPRGYPGRRVIATLRLVRYRAPHAAVALERVGSHRVLHARTPALLARRQVANSHAQVPGFGFAAAALSGHHGWWRGGPRPHTGTSSAHDYARRVGQGTQTHVVVMGEGRPGGIEPFPMAGGVRSFLGQSIAQRDGGAIHRSASSASSQRHLSGRVPHTARPPSNRVRRAVRVGLSTVRRGNTALRLAPSAQGSRCAPTLGCDAQRLRRRNSCADESFQHDSLNAYGASPWAEVARTLWCHFLATQMLELHGGHRRPYKCTAATGDLRL